MNKANYAFFECEACCRGFAVEEDLNDPVEGPICPTPGCESDNNRFIGTVELPLPLPIKET